VSAPWTPSHTNVSYPPGVGTVAPTERCNVFVPDGSAPSGGWPVLIWIEETALTAGTRQTSIAAGLNIGHQCLARGIAFVSATVARVAPSGAEAVTGGGLFDRPGQARWNSGTYPSAWKSAVHLVQWARSQAATYGFDASDVSIGGELAGADLALWAGAGPDWPTVGGSAQFRSGVSHRAQGVVALRPCGMFPAVAIATAAVGFAESGAPGTPAAQLGDVDSADLIGASPCSVLFDAAGVRTSNASQPVFVWGSGAVGSADFTLASSVPTLSNTLATTGDAWGAHMLRRQLMGLGGGAFRFHERSSTALHSARYQDRTGYATEILADDEDVYARAAQWVAGVAGNAPPMEPAAERVVRNVMASLLSVRAGATYWHTIWNVNRGPSTQALKDSALPNVWVTSFGTDAQGAGRDQTATNERTLRIQVDGYMLAGTQHGPARAERLAHDMERAILADPTQCGLAIDTLVTDVAIGIPPTDQMQSFGASLTVEVRYRTVSTDLLLTT
jgi:hypothetical protein